MTDGIEKILTIPNFFRILSYLVVTIFIVSFILNVNINDTPDFYRGMIAGALLAYLLLVVGNSLGKYLGLFEKKEKVKQDEK